MLRCLLFGLLCVSVVYSACICEYPNQPPPGYDVSDWPNFFIQNPLSNDIQNGAPCAPMNCTYNLDSGSDDQGIGGYHVFRWDMDNATNYLNIYNADKNYTPDTSNPLAYQLTFNETAPTFVSSSRHVVVQLFSTSAVTILVSLVRKPIAAPPTMATTTLPPPPTTTYGGPFGKDPALISLDVLFMVDGGYNGGRQQAFNESRYLTAAIVDHFNPGAVWAMNVSQAPTYGSRMTLRYLTNINSENIGWPWNESPSFISNQVKNVFQVQNSATFYVPALTHLLDPKNSPFSIKNDETYSYQNSRNTSQRVAIIVASSVPTDLNDVGSQSTQAMFTALDVHPIFIAYNMSDDDNSKIKKALTSFWGFYAVPNLSNVTAAVLPFFNGYLEDSTQVCFVNTTVSAPSTTQNEVHYPSNYTMVKDAWDENHQTGRYCNFQTFSYTFNVDSGVILLFNVTYELEAGRDFLSFYQEDGTEIVTLSGQDIGPSSFYTKGKTKATFTSNESQVFGGFSISYQTVTSAP